MLFSDCLCVSSSNALLGDLSGVSRSVERDHLSLLLIYPRIFIEYVHRISSLIRDILL